jgi:hypothetical protein
MDCEIEIEIERQEEAAHIHDVDILFSGDSPHPTRLECVTPGCEWVGEVRDGV